MTRIGFRQVQAALFTVLTTVSLYIRSIDALSSPFGNTAKNVATQILQGAGPASGDLNEFNIPADEIAGEWKANLVQKANQNSASVKLDCRTPDYFVDTLEVVFPRQPNQGLGLSLEELAGGREDGLGITIVTEATGPADGSILYGDSLSKVSLVRKSQNPSNGAELVEEFVAQTQCLSFDATVEAISSLPPCMSGDKKNAIEETWVLNVKRIRRKPKVSVRLLYPPSQDEEDTTLELFAGENLRQGMLIRGVKLNDPLAKRFDTKNSGNCGAGGLCRTCSVVVQNGADLLNPQRLAEQQMLGDQPRWRLACKAIVGYGMKEGSMTIRVNPNQW